MSCLGFLFQDLFNFFLFLFFSIEAYGKLGLKSLSFLLLLVLLLFFFFFFLCTIPTGDWELGQGWQKGKKKGGVKYEKKRKKKRKIRKVALNIHFFNDIIISFS